MPPFIKRITPIAASAVLLGALTALPSSAATWNFNGDSIGKTVPFSEANSGITASFSQGAIPFQPNLLSVQSDLSAFGGTGYTPVSWGNYLFDGLPGTLQPHVLDITFSEPLSSISFDFATGNGALVDIKLTTSVGSATAIGADPNLTGLTLPWGTLSFASVSPFSQVEITIPANPAGIQNFIVDNISVQAAAVQPVADQGVNILLIGSVLVGLVYVARRQQKLQAI